MFWSNLITGVAYYAITIQLFIFINNPKVCPIGVKLSLFEVMYTVPLLLYFAAAGFTIVPRCKQFH